MYIKQLYIFKNDIVFVKKSVAKLWNSAYNTFISLQGRPVWCGSPARKSQESKGVVDESMEKGGRRAGDDNSRSVYVYRLR